MCSVNVFPHIPQIQLLSLFSNIFSTALLRYYWHVTLYMCKYCGDTQYFLMFTTVKLANTSFTSHNYCIGVVILRVFKIYSQQLSGISVQCCSNSTVVQYSHQQQFVKKCFSFLIGLPCLAPLLKINLLIGAFILST